MNLNAPKKKKNPTNILKKLKGIFSFKLPFCASKEPLPPPTLIHLLLSVGLFSLLVLKFSTSMIRLKNLIKKLDKMIGFVSTPDPHTAQLTGSKLLRDFLSTRSTTDFLLQRERYI